MAKKLTAQKSAWKGAPEHSMVAFKLPFDGVVSAECNYVSEKNPAYPCVGLTITDSNERIGSGNQHLHTIKAAVLASEPGTEEQFLIDKDLEYDFNWNKFRFTIEDGLIVKLMSKEPVAETPAKK